MTLESYKSDDLDGLSLRLLDLCARLRTMARRSREEQMPSIELHDRKALEWLDNIEAWLDRVEVEFEHAVISHRGKRAAKKAAGRPK